MQKGADATSPGAGVARLQGSLPSRVLLLLLLVLTCAHTAAGQDYTAELELRAFRDFSYSLHQADTLREPGAWRSGAYSGLEKVMAGWEGAARPLFAAGKELEWERRQLRGALEELLEKRYADWLIVRFFREEIPRLEYTRLYRAVARTNAALLERGGETGGRGGNDTHESSGRSESHMPEVREAWRDAVAGDMEAELSQWQASLRQLPAELAASVEEGRRRYLTRRYGEALQDYTAAVRQEVHTLFLQQERLFLAQMGGEGGRQRAEQGVEIIGSAAEALIRSAEERAAAGIARLRAGLPPEGGSGAAEAAEMDPERWRAGFYRHLDAGLAAWKRAERELLSERAAWEERNAAAFRENEGAWGRAYRLLAERRSRWRQEMTSILHRGSERWQEREEALVREISAASSRLDEHIREGEERLNARLAECTGSLVEARRIQAAARESLDFWLGKEGLDAAHVVNKGGVTGRAARELWCGALRQAIDEQGEAGAERTPPAGSIEFAHFLRNRLQERTSYFGLDMEQGENPFSVEQQAAWRAAFREGNGTAVQDRALAEGAALFQRALDHVLGREEYTRLSYWHKLWDTAGEDATAAQLALENIGAHMVNDGGLSSESAARGGETSGIAYGSMYKKDAWRHHYLDDYQVELVKAAERARYWREQLELVEEVYDYALRRGTSGEEDEAIAQRYQAALENFRIAREACTLAEEREQSSGARAKEELREALHAAKLELRKAQALHDYSLSGILPLPSSAARVGPAGETSEQRGAQGLRLQLRSVRRKQKAAERVFELLDELYTEDARPRDFMELSDTPAGKRYRSAYRQYRRRLFDTIALERLAGLFENAVGRQKAAVAEARRSRDTAFGALFPAAGFSEEYGTLCAELNEDKVLWQDHIVLERNGTGLPAVRFAERSSAAAKQGLFDYLTAHGREGEKESETPGLKKDLAVWSRRMASFIHTRGKARLEQWGLAYWHWMHSLGERTDSPAAEELASSYTERNSPDALLGLDSAAAFMKDGAASARLPIRYAQELKQAAREAFNGMEQDERELFDFYMMLKQLNLLEDSEFMELSPRVTVQRYCRRKLAQGRRYHRKKRDTAGALALLHVLQPVQMAFFTASWCIHNGKMEAFEAQETSLRARLDAGTRSMRSSRSRFVSGLNDYLSAQDRLGQEEHRLAILRDARTGEEGTGREELLAALTASGDLLGLDMAEVIDAGEEGAASNSTEELIEAFVLRLCDAHPAQHWADTGEALEALGESARQDLVESAKLLGSEAIALYGEQREAVRQYEAAVGAALQGGLEGGLPDAHLEKAVERAFARPRFSLRQHQQRLYRLSRTAGTVITEAIAADESTRMISVLAELYGSHAQSGGIGSIGLGLRRMNRSRWERYREVCGFKWQAELAEVRQKRMQWEGMAKELLRSGGRKWNAAFDQLRNAQGRWLETCEEQYKARTALWGRKYSRLKESEAEWIEDAAVRVSEASAKALGEQLGSAAESTTHSFGAVLVPGIEGVRVAPEQVVQEVMDERGLGGLLEQARRLARNASHEYYRKNLARTSAHAPVSHTLPALQQRLSIDTEEMKKHVALITARKARTYIHSAVESLYEQGEKANERVEQSVERRLTRAGYSRRGSSYQRRVAVFATLFGGSRYELQHIEGYHYYQMPEIELSTALGDETLARMDGEEIDAQLELAMNEILEQRTVIFGEDGEGEGARSAPAGSFEAHIGRAPELVGRPDPQRGIRDNLEDVGSGEMGRIMRQFLDHQLKEAQGLGMATAPLYELPMWDGREGPFSWMEAPSLRDTVGIAATVAAGVATGGAGSVLGAALTSGAVASGDDLLFGAMDLAGGYSDVWQVMGELGTSAAISAGGSLIGSAVGGAGELAGGGFFESGVSGLLEDSLGSEVLAQSLSTGIEAGLSATLASGLQAVRWNKLGTQAWWNGRAFQRGVTGTAAIAGYLGGMGGSFITSSLNSSVFGVVGEGYRDVHALNSVAGSAAEFGIQYGMVGQASVNVLAARDLGLPTGTGLLQLSFGGEGGVSGSLSTAGVGMHLGTVANALGGLSVYNKMGEIHRAGFRGDTAVALRLLSTAGMKATDERYRELIDGRAYLLADERLQGQGLTERTAEGRILMRLHPSPSPVQGLQLGLMLTHEAHRNGIDDGLIEQRSETVRATLGHMAAAHMVAAAYGTDVLNSRMQDEAERFSTAAATGKWSGLGRWTLENYASNGDYWKLLTYADGSHEIVNDGKKELTVEYLDYRRDARGRILRDAQDRPLFHTLSRTQVEASIPSQAGALSQYLGMERMGALLGFNTDRLRNYDDASLRDVLRLTDQDLAAIRRGETQALSLTVDEKHRLMGEALLKQGGLHWDSTLGRWAGNSSFAVRMTDTLTKGFINVAPLGDGGYDRSSALLTVARDPRSYLLYQDANGPYDQYNGLDSVTITAYELDGELREQRTFDGWTTVQNSVPGVHTETGKGYDYSDFLNRQAHTLYGQEMPIRVGPETVREGDIAWTIESQKYDWTEVGIHRGDPILRYSAGRLIAGNSINNEGHANYNYGRHLVHPTANFTSEGCAVTGDTREMSGLEQYQEFVTYLNEKLHHNIGYTLLGELRQKHNPYLYVY